MLEGVYYQKHTLFEGAKPLINFRYTLQQDEFDLKCLEVTILNKDFYIRKADKVKAVIDEISKTYGDYKFRIFVKIGFKVMGKNGFW